MEVSSYNTYCVKNNLFVIMHKKINSEPTNLSNYNSYLMYEAVGKNRFNQPFHKRPNDIR